MRALIELCGASMSYGGRRVLDRLSWQLMPGEHWAVVGPSGAGKTTLLRLLRGEIRPCPQQPDYPPAVTWSFDGTPDTSPLAIRPISSLLSPELQRHYVRQGWQLTGEDVVLSGFGDGYMLYDLPSRAERDAAYALAVRLGAAHLMNAMAPDMSQGQLRLVLLARALVKKPRLLLLDEPCGGLDAAGKKRIFSVLEELAGETSIICAIHTGEDIPSCLTNVMKIKDGKISRSGLLDRSAILAATTQVPKILPHKPIPAAEGVSIFRLKNADVYIKRKKILHSLDWEVKSGENWLLSGPNGSGKTTLLRVLLGEEHVALGGSLKWFGKESQATLQERRRHTGHVSDWLLSSHRYDLTGRELVISGLLGSVGLYRQPTPAEEKEADHWLQKLKLAPLAGKRLENMSEGIARRFLLARALAPRPKLLLLDEPCSGLDGDARAEFMHLAHLALDHGSQIIFVSHNQTDLDGIDSVLTHELRLQNGRIGYCGIYKYNPIQE